MTQPNPANPGEAPRPPFSTDTLGQGYAWMALSAFLVIAIDQTFVLVHAASGRIALDALIGAALGLASLKLVTLVRRVRRRR